MNWYLIHTKPKQEKVALENLERQGYECYLPMLGVEKIRQASLVVSDEPLFPRYLFVRLDTGETAKSWSPIRSTRGVSRLVTFGTEPARVDDRIILGLKGQELLVKNCPQRLFSGGERIRVTEGQFAGIEGVYKMPDGDTRAMVLIELISKPVSVLVPVAGLRKIG